MKLVQHEAIISQPGTGQLDQMAVMRENEHLRVLAEPLQYIKCRAGAIVVERYKQVVGDERQRLRRIQIFLYQGQA